MGPLQEDATLIAKPENSDATQAQSGREIVAKLLTLIETSLDDDKGEDIVTIDLNGKTSIADYMVVASGRSSRQVMAMTAKLSERLKDAGFGVPKIDGKQTGDWIVVDTGDVIVHLFRPEVREFYKIERLWSVSPSDEDNADDRAEDSAED